MKLNYISLWSLERAKKVTPNGNLYAWLHEEHSIALRIAQTVQEEGLTYHSMGKTGHTHCPGIAVINQRPEILELTNYMIENKASPSY